jgi:hypothetical protein
MRTGHLQIQAQDEQRRSETSFATFLIGRDGLPPLDLPQALSAACFLMVLCFSLTAQVCPKPAAPIHFSEMERFREQKKKNTQYPYLPPTSPGCL